MATTTGILPTESALQACPITKQRVNALMEAHGLQLYNYITDAENEAVRTVWRSIPSGNSCWMDAWLALYQWHNGIGDYATPARPAGAKE